MDSPLKPLKTVLFSLVDNPLPSSPLFLRLPYRTYVRIFTTYVFSEKRTLLNSTEGHFNGISWLGEHMHNIGTLLMPVHDLGLVC